MSQSDATALSDLISLHDAHAGPKRLSRSLGDGYLYDRNPYFRRVRDATLAADFELTTRDPNAYFGFPLASLESVLRTRKIPYRDNVAAVARLERERPGFFTLADLNANRPTPNYLLHESAHAVAFATLFGKPTNPRHALADPGRLVHVMTGEAYAMTAEYLAACAVTGPVERWFFSINSYRHRVQGRKAIGELIEELGLPPVAWAIFAAFLYNNFFVERLDAATLDRIVSFFPGRGAPTTERAKRRLRSTLGKLMVMSPEFRRDTTRLFLTALGYPRDVRRVLRGDPLEMSESDDRFVDATSKLITWIATD